MPLGPVPSNPGILNPSFLGIDALIMIIRTIKATPLPAPAVARFVTDPYTDDEMPRHKKMRYCRGIEGYNLYKPSGIPMSQLEVVDLGLDELEAMRLCDFEAKQQEAAAEAMGVSRGTIQRLLETGRKKLLDSIVHGKALCFGDADHVCVRPERFPGPGRPGRHGRRGPRSPDA
jgi:predicted DNA-binding protein (UPF0251 family)